MVILYLHLITSLDFKYSHEHGSLVTASIKLIATMSEIQPQSYPLVNCIDVESLQTEVIIILESCSLSRLCKSLSVHQPNVAVQLFVQNWVWKSQF